MSETQPDYEVRPFAGLPSEADWVALRKLVPAATATAQLNAAHSAKPVQVVTLLPDLHPAWQRADGQPVLALQSAYASADPGLDLGQALELALKAEPGNPVTSIDPGAPSPRLQDMLDLDFDFTVTVHQTFEYWKDLDPDDADMTQAIEDASKAIDPTDAVPDTPSAYWTKLGGRPYLRWSLGIEETELLDALARLQAKRQAGVVDGAKYVGAFRSLGMIIPVWELPTGTEAADLTDPLGSFRERLNKALAVGDDLSVAERRARAGLVARSVTLR
ncbi:MAG: DUF5926 family protein [Bifidobacteriaceae bacterium]|jgi:hypothetical protein|nr:DUF5926 family protein [Bifidobacteriaceae bacterium]